MLKYFKSYIVGSTNYENDILKINSVFIVL